MVASSSFRVDVFEASGEALVLNLTPLSWGRVALLAGAAAVFAIAAAAVPATVVASTGSSSPGALPAGGTLTQGQSLASPSGLYRLSMQGDGNLVEYDTATGSPAWAAGTTPSGAVAAMQGDGNLVIYDGTGKALWASNTSGNPGAYLSLPDTGQLAVLSTSGVPLWAGTGVLVPNATLAQGHSLTSPSGRYRLTMQGDGNLVEYTPGGTPVWAAGTAPAGTVVAMQGDGNLVVYNAAKKALWASNTSTPGAYLSLLDTGQLAVISPAGTPLWAGPGELASNASMTRGGSLSSPSGAFLLTMQGDGNLVEYSAAGAVMWAASTNPSGAHAVMQGDGNLVVYDGSGKPLWASNTPGSPGAYLGLLDSGQLSVDAAATGSPLWGPGLMPAGASLSSGQSLISPTGRYRLTLQSDGNLVEYTAGGTAAWSASTGPSGAMAVMQGDGNFVVYDAASRALWSSQTSGKPGAYLWQSDDGQLSVLSVTGAATLWQPTPGPRPCTDTWTGATSAQWSDAANWSTGAPVSSDWVCIPANAANEPVQLTTSVSVDGVTNTGTLAVSGNLDLTDPSSPTSNVGTLNVSGLVSLAGELDTPGPLNVQNGTVAGPGQLTVPSGAQLTVTSADSATLTGEVTVVVDGAMALQGSSDVDFENGSSIENYGTLSLADSSQFLSYGSPNGAVINERGATISYPGDPAQIATLDADLTNDGSIVVGGGTLRLTAYTTTTSSGSFSGTGTLQIDGTLQPAASLGITQPVVVDGTIQLPSSVVATLSSLTLTGCASIQGPGTLEVPSGGQLTVPAQQYCPTSVTGDATLLVYGAMVVQSSSIVSVQSGSTLDNHGTLSLADGATLDPYCIVQGCLASYGTAFNAQGATVLYSGTSGNSADIALDLTNAGVVSVGGGTLQLPETTTVTSTGSFSGSGTLAVGGTLDLAGSLTISQPVTVYGTLELESGVTATLPATLTLEQGTVQGPGTLTVPSGGQLTVQAGSASLTGNVTVVVHGAMAVQGNASLDVPFGTTVENYGTLSLADGSDLGESQNCDYNPGGCGTVVNEPGATLSYPGSSRQAAVVYADLSNAGVVSVGGGTLQLTDTTTVTSTGSFRGPGTLEVDGILDLTASLTISQPVTVSGTLELGSSVTATLPSLTLGAVQGPGTLTVPSGGQLTIPSYGVSGLTGGATVVVDGAMALQGYASLGADSGTKLENYGTLSLADGSDLGSSNCRYLTGGCGTVVNEAGATLSYPGTSGQTAVVYVDLTNAGTVSVGGGTLALAATTTVTSTGSFAGSGTLEVDGGTLDLMASLTISQPVTGEGTLELDGSGPGNFGKLVLSGSVAAGNFDLYLNGGPSYLPACGTSVTALQAALVSGAFGNVSSSGSLPSSGTWQATGTSTTAGGYLSCPVPSVPAAQTYGQTGSPGLSASGDTIDPSGSFAEPVDTATGAYSTTETDASLAGLGVPFSFTRSYTSANPYSGPLGPGWTDSLNTLVLPGTGQVTLQSGNGQTTVYTQNSNGSYTGGPGAESVLTSVSGGGWLVVRHDQEHLTFNSSGQMISWTDRNGIGLTLTYNGSGELASVTDYGGRTVTFSYDSSGLLTQMSFPASRTVTYSYNSSGQLTSVTDTAGGVTSYTYNAQGLLATITDQDGHQVVGNTYDSSGQVVSQVNALGKTATFAYDPSTATTTYTDPNGGQWQDIYDGNALVERIDPTGGVTEYTYDASLNLVAKRDPNGNTTTMTYDGSGNMLSETAPAPISTTQTWSYDSFNDVSAYTDAAGNTTSYTYDSRGDLTQETLPGGSILSYTRDATTGVATSATDERGNTTAYGYDSAGDLVSVTSPLGEKTTYTYDSVGRRTAMVAPLGNVSGGNPAQYTTSYTYDVLDRLTSTTDPNGHTTSSTYDAVGNKLSVTDPNHNTTSYAYDPGDELIKVTAPGGSTTKYTYDGDGNRLSVRDGDGNTTTYAYDADDRQVSVTDALGAKTSYAYDADGHRVSLTDAVGATTSSTYDVLGRLLSISYSDGTPGVSYAYTADGQRASMSDGTGTTQYGYNSRDELTSVAGAGGAYSYAYDKAGEVVSRDYPDGTSISYGYDADGRMTSLGVGGTTTTYSYDADSELTSTSLPNGQAEAHSYDPAGLLTAIDDTVGTNTVAGVTYTYDAAGNPTSAVTAAGETDTYGYDSQNRVTGACYGSSCSAGSISYSYDSDGNRTAETTASGTTTYSHNAADELTQATSGSGSVSYSYNADGQMTAAGATTYSYNAADQLTQVSSGSGTTTYTYNGDGLRASETAAGTTTDFSYDVSTAVPELVSETQGSSELRGYVWAGGVVQSMETGGSTYYVAHDALGSTTALTSSTGAVETLYTYDPFGASRSTTNVASTPPTMPLQFAGEYLDPTSGLYYLDARYLNPTLGAFTATDPLPALAQQPATSPYLYANDRPTVLIDPTGDCGESAGQSDLLVAPGYVITPNGQMIIRTGGGSTGPQRPAASRASTSPVDVTDQVINQDLATYGYNQQEFNRSVGYLTGSNNPPYLNIEAAAQPSGVLGGVLNIVNLRQASQVNFSGNYAVGP